MYLNYISHNSCPAPIILFLMITKEKIQFCLHIFIKFTNQQKVIKILNFNNLTILHLASGIIYC